MMQGGKVSIKFLFVLAFLPGLMLKKPDGYPPPELQELLDGIHQTCTKQMEVTDEEVEKYEITDNSEKMMCYMRCLMIESKWAKKDGHVDYDFILADGTVPEKVKGIVSAAVNKCRDIPAGDGSCQTSYDFMVCLQKADPVHWFLP